MGDLKWTILIPGLIIAGWCAWCLIRRPLLGVFVLLAQTILFDQFCMGPVSILWRPELYNNFNLTLGISQLVFNPPEVVIVLMAVGWLIQATAGRLPGRPLMAVSALGALWMLMVCIAVWWGAVNGGNVKIGLWVLRPVFYFLALGFFTYQLVRSERQVNWMLGVILATVAIKSVATCLLWGIHHRDGVDWECYVSHEDTSFCLYPLWLALGVFFLGTSRRLQITLYALVPVIAAAVMFNDRRINFVTLILGSALILLAMPRGALTRRGVFIFAGAIGVLLYIAVSLMGPKNAVTEPVKGIVSGLQSEVANQNTDSSSQYRKLERYDLLHTVRAYPILGTGLGIRYLQPIELPRLPFEYYVYINHNQILMTHALMGPVAYGVLMLFYLTLFAVLLSYYRQLKDPWHRVLSLAAAASVANWLIVGYYDMQLFFFRNSIFIGVVVALPAALMRMQEFREAGLARLGVPSLPSPLAPPPPPPQPPLPPPPLPPKESACDSAG